MVCYRIIINVILSDLNTAETIKSFLMGLKNNFMTINKGMPNEERSLVEIHECYHDEDPAKPCKPLFRWESD